MTVGRRQIRGGLLDADAGQHSTLADVLQLAEVVLIGGNEQPVDDVRQPGHVTSVDVLEQSLDDVGVDVVYEDFAVDGLPRLMLNMAQKTSELAARITRCAEKRRRTPPPSKSTSTSLNAASASVEARLRRSATVAACSGWTPRDTEFDVERQRAGDEETVPRRWWFFVDELVASYEPAERRAALVTKVEDFETTHATSDVAERADRATTAAAAGGADADRVPRVDLPSVVDAATIDGDVDGDGVVGEILFDDDRPAGAVAGHHWSAFDAAVAVETGEEVVDGPRGRPERQRDADDVLLSDGDGTDDP